MVKSFDGLKGDALIIKNEIEQDKNSATRIGTMFSDVVDKMEDESETQELNLQQAIEAEAQARQEADMNLYDAINAEAQARQTDVSNLDGRLKQEANVRNNAVKAVQEDLDTEVAVREVAYLGDLGSFVGVEAVGFVDSLVASITNLGKGMGKYSFDIGGGGTGSKQFVTLAKVGSLTKLTIEGCLKAEVLNGDGAIDSVTSTVSTVVECDVTKKVWSYVNTVVDDTYLPEMLDEATVDEEAVQRSNKVMSKEQTLGVIGGVRKEAGGKVAKLEEKLKKRIDDLSDEIDKIILLFEQTYTKSGSGSKVLTVNQDLAEGTGYRLTLSNVIANSKIRIFSAASKDVGFNDSEQYFYDIEPTDGVYYLYCNTDAEWLYIQVIESIDTTVNFTAKLEASNLITEVAKQSYLRRNEKPIFTNNSIKTIIEQGFKLGDAIKLTDTNVYGVEDGEIRPLCKRQWSHITPNTDYYISGIANIEKGENIIALFNGVANISTYVNDFDSYVRKGVYDVSFAFNSGEATRVSIPHGINLVPIYGIKEQEQVSLNKTIIDHLVTPTDSQSDITWRGVFSLIPKGSKITECSYMPMAVGSSICAIWKYDDDAKTMQKMEEFIVHSEEVGIKTNIAELQNRVLEYDAFIMFKKDGSNNTAIGWTNDGTNSLLAFSASLGDSFSARDNNLSGSVGHLCVKISYESNYYRHNTSAIEVGKGMAFESLSLAALAASYGDTIIVHKGLYKNQNIQSVGKKIHVVGIDKYSCVLKCDTSDYLNPPIEMNIGSISNMTIIETCENPTVTDEDKTSSGFDRLNMAYCIHADSSVMAVGEVLNIDSCILKNKHRPCLGAGLYQDYSIIMKNTQCHSGMGYINTVSGRNGCRGALYFHTKADDSNTTGQVFFAENCVFECDDNKYATINGYYNNTMKVIFIGNTFWSGIEGKSEEGLSLNVGIGGDSIISLSGKSNGNNVGLLNNE